MEPITIVTFSSDYFAPFLSVMLTSLFLNKKPETELRVYIIDSQISEEYKAGLLKIADRFHAELYFLTIPDELFEDMPTGFHFSKETYFRLLPPLLLDAGIHKAIVVDGDILILEDLAELWNTNIENFYAAAVEEPVERDKACKRIGYPKRFGYFNAGVLLVNLKKWRRYKIPFKIIDFIQHNQEHDPDKVLFLDQDALNALLYKKWLALDPKWNYQTDHVYQKRFDIRPAIIHFNSQEKPWSHDHPLKSIYDQYVELTLRL